MDIEKIKSGISDPMDSALDTIGGKLDDSMSFIKDMKVDK